MRLQKEECHHFTRNTIEKKTQTTNPKNMKTTFLNISDMHYRENRPESLGLVLTNFIEDAKSQLKNSDITYLVFSGDIVHAGSEDHLYVEFEKEIQVLLDDLGISKERRIIIPGNHDVCRDTVSKTSSIYHPAFTKCESEESFIRLLTEASKYFSDKFSNFIKFSKAFTKYSFTEDNIGGFGFSVGNDIAIYCLNSALCSFGGAAISNTAISDMRLLHVDTRSLHSWLQKTDDKCKILLCHHPLEWLAQWSSEELQKIIRNQFNVVISGHEHKQDSYTTLQNNRYCLFAKAPPLFTKKDYNLGYSIVTVDTKSMVADVMYREWIPAKHKFVLGTSFSGNDGGIVSASIDNSTEEKQTNSENRIESDLIDLLKSSMLCYSSLTPKWVPRQISDTPETHHKNSSEMFSETDLLSCEGACLIKAPTQFGLTCLGRKLALEAWRSAGGSYYSYVDASKCQPHESAVYDAVTDLLPDDSPDADSLISGIIIDNWESWNNRHIRLANNAKKVFPSTRILLLCKVDLHNVVQNEIPEKLRFVPKPLYLWTMDRSALYELIDNFVESTDLPDSDIVAERIIDDLDSLCIPRTPLHCLNLLKSSEYIFDESPINRTEVLDRVLHFLFSRYSDIPRYTTRPDLKDCEFALGVFCETLLRRECYEFTKMEFLKIINRYCEQKSICLDSGLLYDFLVKENIFVASSSSRINFRYSYWLYFFAAHRMFHDDEFRSYVLESMRYVHCPELIEFYSGLDRHRSALLVSLTGDLCKLNDGIAVRSKICEDFDPYPLIRWTSNDIEIDKFENEINKSADQSSLSRAIRNSIADRHFDRGRAYNQGIRKFLNDVSFHHTIMAMESACRALRNSEHVDRQIKVDLLEQILRTWKKSIQLAIILVPKLSATGEAVFEDFGFYIENWGPDKVTNMLDVVVNIPSSIVRTSHRLLFSKKNGPLYREFSANTSDPLYSLMCQYMLIFQRPPGWQQDLENYVDRLDKNDFYLREILGLADSERKESFLAQVDSDSLREIMARVIIKKDRGRSNPGKKLLDRVVNRMKENENL